MEVAAERSAKQQAQQELRELTDKEEQLQARVTELEQTVSSSTCIVTQLPLFQSDISSSSFHSYPEFLTKSDYLYKFQTENE